MSEESEPTRICRLVNQHCIWEFGQRVSATDCRVVLHPDPSLWISRAFVTETSQDPEEFWFVSGDVPTLSFNMNEIQYPEEALAMWAWFVRRWMMVKGQGRSDLDDELMPLRDPESGRAMTMQREDTMWMNKPLNRVLYQLLPTMSMNIQDTEIRKRLKTMGVALASSS